MKMYITIVKTFIVLQLMIVPTYIVRQHLDVHHTDHGASLYRPRCFGMMDTAHSNRRVVCPTCRRPFILGWGYTNHVRSCVTGHQDLTEPNGDDDQNLGANHDVMYDIDSSDSNVEVEEVYSIEEHQKKLDEEGTLDEDHLTQYTGWSKVDLEPDEVETCKFLRSVETGGGSSEGKSYAALMYAKSLGGRGDLLPKTMRTCWKTVTKVRCCIMFIMRYISLAL